jgi:hypothetical protein
MRAAGSSLFVGAFTLLLPACGASAPEPTTIVVAALPASTAATSAAATSAAPSSKRAPGRSDPGGPNVAAPEFPGPPLEVAGAPGLNGGGGLTGPGIPGVPSGMPSGVPAVLAPPPGPVASVEIGAPQVGKSVVVSNAAAVVAGMAAGFRRCLTRALQQDPQSVKDGATLAVTAKIGAQGEVLSVSPTGGNGIDASALACISARVGSAQFAPPEGGQSATVRIPIIAHVKAP